MGRKFRLCLKKHYSSPSLTVSVPLNKVEISVAACTSLTENLEISIPQSVIELDNIEQLFCRIKTCGILSNGMEHFTLLRV